MTPEERIAELEQALREIAEAANEWNEAVSDQARTDAKRKLRRLIEEAWWGSSQPA